MSEAESSQSEGSLATTRSKRTLKDKHGRKAAFERLRDLKGSKHKYEVGEVKKVYDEIDEKEYVKKRQNRMEEDWIIDDDGLGYVEDGREIFDDDDDDLNDEIFISKKQKEKSSSKKHQTVRSESKPLGGNLKRMFANMPTKKRKMESKEMNEAEKALLEECLSEETANNDSVKRAVPFTYERKSIRPTFDAKKLKLSAPIEKRTLQMSTPKEKRTLQRVCMPEVRTPLKPLNEDYSAKESRAPSPDVSLDEPMNMTAMDEDDELDDLSLLEAASCEEKKSFEDTDNRSKSISVQKHESNPQPEAVRSAPENKTSFSVWENSTVIADKEKCSPSVEVRIDASQLPLVTNSEGEKVLRFFWLDAYEDYFAHPGIVYLFGKVFVESANTHVSCCVIVKNINRRIFLLPRLKRLNKATKTEGEEVTMSSVYQEFNEVIATKYKILEFKMRKTKMKYCFEKQDVPEEADYMEVRYSARYHALPQTLEGETFSHVFGANTTSLELLLVERKIKGPCWLDVKVPQPSSPPVSWCKIECVANQPDCIVPVVGVNPPPLVIASLRFQTAINPKSQQNEIVLVSCLTHRQFFIDKTAPANLFQTHFCALTRPVDHVWPWDFNAKLENYKGTSVSKNEGERSLLGMFLANLQQIDPDVIIGHDILAFDLSVLLHRIQANKIPQWSRIGRLRRTQFPKLTTRGVAERQALCGRLVCDVKITAKELIRAKSYELGPLVHQILRVDENERPEYSCEEVKKCFGSTEKIFNLINATMQDAFYCLKLVTELNALPLALQITNIAGNVMSRTLLGGRSERNEFLLLHAFAEKSFICPDKQYGTKAKGSGALANGGDEDETQLVSKNGKKKVSYTGGLVLEPKKGFYDKYILLMDFNSLYPSIIQEYNICFTTVNRFFSAKGKEGEMDLPELPEPDLKPGILPAEIRKLVESRREVKKLMKQADNSPELKQQYDIRQKALKLTANSMYGCLGFSNSRFFACHLAALITGKGREILLHTKDLVQKLNFEVIYGDTDSIMINTNCADYDQVFKLGHRIKMEVNKLYKQLELDVDGVFKYMLLLKKKKYAAITISKLPSGDIITEKELKGLDIVRRDWSQVAADAGNYILDQILSDLSPDERIERIHSHLQTLKTRLQEEKVNLDLLAITKQLTKDPSNYPDKNSLPHVQVALRVNSKGGKKLRQGDTVPYVICQDGSNLGAMQRAYHVDEVKGSEHLKIDTQYYLAQQIHPVVARLCDPIEGTDAARIAECLGLDPSNYRSSNSGSGEREDDIPTTDISEEEKFRLCKRFSFKCPSPECQMLISLDEPTRGTGAACEFVLQSCPDPKCKSAPYKHYPYIQNRLRMEIREHIATYYKGWMICEDPGCNNRTRRIPLTFNRGFPMCNQCGKGFLFREYNESQLYKQLCFYDYVFDYQKSCLRNKDIRTKHDGLKRAYFALQNEVQKFLKLNSFSVINLGSIFATLYLPNSSKTRT